VPLALGRVLLGSLPSGTFNGFHRSAPNRDRTVVCNRFMAPSSLAVTVMGRPDAYGGVTADNMTLTYTVPPASPVPATGVTGAAYTNNDLDSSTATTLFDLDTMMDQIAIQSPPATGILAATGRLGVDAGVVAGFDIYSRLDDQSVTVTNHALASLSVNGAQSLYLIRLTTGRAFRLGTLGQAVVDIAVPLAQ
jgi:hypothetical protein